MERRAAQPNSDPSPLLRTRKKAQSAGSPRRNQLHRSTSFVSAEFFLDDNVAEDGSSYLDTLWRPHTCNEIPSSSGSYSKCRIRVASEEDPQAALDRDHTLNLLAWEIIDREISEWQHVCITGRPGWWSPVSTNNRYVPSSDVQQRDMFWDVQEIDGRAKIRSGDRRRASLSDGVLSNNIPLQELAHLIALQLLSACFTLPPENIAVSIPSVFHYYDTVISSGLPDPHLISSLRMHTHFRYTPSFGHDARNPSPAKSWPNSFDGSPHLDSLTNLKISSQPYRPGSLSKRSMNGTLHSYSQNFKRRKRNHRRALNVTEESKASVSLETDSSNFNSQSANHDELELIDLSVPLDKGKGVQSSRHEVSAQASSANHAPSSSPPAEFGTENPTDQGVGPLTPPNPAQLSPISGVKPFRVHVENPRTPPSSRVACLGNNEIHRPRRSLRAIIRSDPHPVFVQPVKKLVIRRWRNFRRRFGQPSGSAALNPSQDFSNMATLPGHLAWPRRTHSSDGTSPLSSGARERRRRARERGHIRSESWESSIRHTTPIHSGILSPEATSEMSFTSEDAENFLSPSAVSESWLSRDEVPLYPSPNTPDQEIQNTPPDTESRDVVHNHPLNLPNTREPPRTRRSGRRSQSRMSDVLTPDDALAADANRNVPSDVGSSMQSPVVEPSESMTGAIITNAIAPYLLPSSTASLPADVNRAPDRASDANQSAASSASGTTSAAPINSSLLDATAVLTTKSAISQEERTVQDEDLRERTHCLHRTSTSGTQVWKPAAEGIEIDGLPVGPTMNEKAWEGRREGSFL